MSVISITYWPSDLLPFINWISHITLFSEASDFQRIVPFPPECYQEYISHIQCVSFYLTTYPGCVGPRFKELWKIRHDKFQEMYLSYHSLTAISARAPSPVLADMIVNRIPVLFMVDAVSSKASSAVIYVMTTRNNRGNTQCLGLWSFRFINKHISINKH